MAKMSIVGDVAYNRKDNRAEIQANVSFEDNIYQTIDLGFGGFRIDGYGGELKPGQEFILDGIGPADEEVFMVRVDCLVARRLGSQLGVGFTELSSDAYDILEALLMRRKKFFDKLKSKQRPG